MSPTVTQEIATMKKVYDSQMHTSMGGQAWANEPHDAWSEPWQRSHFIAIVGATCHHTIRNMVDLNLLVIILIYLMPLVVWIIYNSHEKVNDRGHRRPTIGFAPRFY